jgi:hypothetical protein
MSRSADQNLIRVIPAKTGAIAVGPGGLLLIADRLYLRIRSVAR